MLASQVGEIENLEQKYGSSGKPSPATKCVQFISQLQKDSKH